MTDFSDQKAKTLGKSNEDTQSAGFWQCNGKHSKSVPTGTKHNATNATQKRDYIRKYGCEAWTAIQSVDKSVE